MSPHRVVSIRYVADGFLAASHTMLVVVNGTAHLVSCRIDPDMDHPEIDRRFGMLNPVIIGDVGLRELAVHIAELRMSDAISSPVRWCCREQVMTDFSSLPANSPVSPADLQIGALADLSNKVKMNVIAFSHARLHPTLTRGVAVRLKRVTIPLAA